MSTPTAAPGSTREPAAAATAEPPWRPPWIWRAGLMLARVIVPLVCRLRVTGDVPDERRHGPLILAGNHIATFDPVAFTAASGIRRLAPRMMATGGLFRVPVVGPFMRASGHIQVDRGRDTVTNAVPDAVAALRAGSVVFIYPEGRIGLDPALWPERAKSGLARLALAARVPVVPVAIWGSHEVIAYHGAAAMLGTLVRSIWRRPVVRVHFGPPVDLADVPTGRPGAAQQASERIMAAIAAALAPLRTDEPGLPRHQDPTRPLSTARARRDSGR